MTTASAEQYFVLPSETNTLDPYAPLHQFRVYYRPLDDLWVIQYLYNDAPAFEREEKSRSGAMSWVHRAMAVVLEEFGYGELDPEEVSMRIGGI